MTICTGANVYSICKFNYNRFYVTYEYDDTRYITIQIVYFATLSIYICVIICLGTILHTSHSQTSKQ